MDTLPPIVVLPDIPTPPCTTNAPVLVDTDDNRVDVPIVTEFGTIGVLIYNNNIIIIVIIYF